MSGFLRLQFLSGVAGVGFKILLLFRLITLAMFSMQLEYTNNSPPCSRDQQRRKRSREIIWFNPPFSQSVSTNVGQIFLRVLDMHFPKSHKLHKIFNRGSVKISYSYMENMARKLANKHYPGKIYLEPERRRNQLPYQMVCFETRQSVLIINDLKAEMCKHDNIYTHFFYIKEPFLIRACGDEQCPKFKNMLRI